MIGQLIASFELDTSNFERSYRKLDRRFQRMQRDVFSLQSAFLALGGSMVARDLVRTAVELDRVNNTLKFATGSAEGAAAAMEFLRTEADRLGQDVLKSANTFAQLTAAAKGTELSAEEVKEIFLGVSEAATVLGLSADQAQGALRSIEQMISKGNVQAEELRGQLGERLPGAFQIAARAMGVTTEELNDMLERGDVLAEDMLPLLAKELRKTFGPDVAASADSTQAQINRLNNRLLDVKTTLIDAGLVDAIMTFVGWLGTGTEKTLEFAKGIGIFVASLQGFSAVDDIGVVVDQIEHLERQLTLLNAADVGVLDNLLGKDDDIAAQKEEIKRRVEALKVYRDKLINDANTITPDEVGGGESSATVLNATSGAVDTARVKYYSLAETLGLVEVRQEGMNELYREAHSLTQSVMTEQEIYNASIAKYGNLLEQNLISQETFNRLSEEAKDQLEANAEGFDFMEQAATSAARSMQSSLADFFLNMDDGIDGMLKGFVDALRQMTAQMLAFQTLKAAFGGTDIGAFFGVNAPGKALGGPVSAGKPYMVGEVGPELFVPNQSGTIVPNNKMGGNNVTINMPVDARYVQSPAQMMAMMGQFEGKIYNNVARMLQGHAPA